MQATAQDFVDNAISKTINADADIPYEAFADVYRKAYDLGLKGCTVYRQGSAAKTF
jgi:ribonucleoside-diphosphate reductase alpha chain